VTWTFVPSPWPTCTRPAVGGYMGGYLNSGCVIVTPTATLTPTASATLTPTPSVTWTPFATPTAPYYVPPATPTATPSVAMIFTGQGAGTPPLWKALQQDGTIDASGNLTITKAGNGTGNFQAGSVSIGTAASGTSGTLTARANSNAFVSF